jgi:CHRD domain
MSTKTKLIIAAVAVAAAGIGATGAIAAQAYGSGDHSPPALVPAAKTAPMDHAMDHMMDPATGNAETAKASGPVTFLAAELTGRNEVPAQGGPKVGDPDGRAIEVFRIQGDKVSFAVAWKGIGAPTLSHIHEGAAGVNGAVKVPFFGTALPDTVSAATGAVTVTDQALLDSITENPGKFYANLHTAEFPGGAVRGQLRKLDRPVDLQRVLNFGSLASLDSGDQEVPVAGGPATGDPDGHATSFVWANGSRVDYSFTWSGIAGPTLGHIHQGPVGANGGVVVPLFSAPAGIPSSVTGIAGTASNVDPKVVENIGRNPGDFYTNLHTAEFPGGAVRGQLFRSGSPNVDPE